MVRYAPASSGQIRYAADDHHLAAAIEVDEREHGGLAARRRLRVFDHRPVPATSRYQHLLRIWNYLDDINSGDGDDERYRVFCSGRSEGLQALQPRPFPGRHGHRPARRFRHAAGVLAGWP